MIYNLVARKINKNLLKQSKQYNLMEVLVSQLVLKLLWIK